MTQFVHHPERITKPMRRLGERGENKWEEISWDEAYDYIEEKMNKIRDEYGPESMIFSMGTGRDVGSTSDAHNSHHRSKIYNKN